MQITVSQRAHAARRFPDFFVQKWVFAENVVFSWSSKMNFLAKIEICTQDAHDGVVIAENLDTAASDEVEPCQNVATMH